MGRKKLDKTKSINTNEIDNLEYEENNVNNTQYTKEDYRGYNTESSERTRALIILVIFSILIIWIVSARDYEYVDPFSDMNNNSQQGENSEQENATGVASIYEFINKLSSNNYEHIYTIETDKESEYFFVRGQVDGEKSLFYKEFNNKTYTYLKKGSTFYTPGINIWKKTSKPMSYEGYDTILFNVKSLYNIISNNSGYEVNTVDNVSKTVFKVDMNKLIEAYNEYAEIGKTIELLEEGTMFVNFNVYTNVDNHFNVEADLKDFYKLVYNKEYTNIYYSLEYYHIGTSSLAGVEEMSMNSEE